MGKPFGPLPAPGARPFIVEVRRGAQVESRHPVIAAVVDADGRLVASWGDAGAMIFPRSSNKALQALPLVERSEEHTSELQSLMRSSYAVFCLKKKTNMMLTHTTIPSTYLNLTTTKNKQDLY